MSTKKVSLHISGKNAPIEGLRAVDISSLSIIPDGSLSSLDISDTLEFIPRLERSLFLQRLSSKLVKNGLVHLTGLDVKRFALSILGGSINNEEAEKILLGRESFIGLEDLKDYVEVVVFWTEGIKFHAEIKLK